MGTHMNVNPCLIVFLGIDHGGNIENIVSHLSLFGFEEVVELKETHHLASAIIEFDKDDALVFEELPIIVVLLLA